MEITDELLNKIKLSRSILDNSSDDVIRQKIAAAIADIKKQGVHENLIIQEDPLVIEAISVFVSDYWTVGGEIKESPAYSSLISRLYSDSAEIREDEKNATS